LYNSVYSDLCIYLTETFGIEEGILTKNIYDVLKSQGYPALYLLFRNISLMQMRNNNESKFSKRKFPLYRLRGICSRNKIVFDNLGNLKINGPFSGFDEEKKPTAYQYKSEEVSLSLYIYI